MNMTEQRLLELITQEGRPALELNYNELTQLYAHHLAAISKKINRDELAEMVMIGVALYQKGLKEFKAGINEKVLFDQLQEKRNNLQ